MLGSKTKFAHCGYKFKPVKAFFIGIIVGAWKEEGNDSVGRAVGVYVVEDRRRWWVCFRSRPRKGPEYYGRLLRTTFDFVFLPKWYILLGQIITGWCCEGYELIKFLVRRFGGIQSIEDFFFLHLELPKMLS